MRCLQNITCVHVVMVGIPIGRVASFYVVQHRLQHAWRNLQHNSQKDFSLKNVSTNLVLVKAAMTCQQFVSQVSKGRSFAHTIQRKGVIVPVIDSLKLDIILG